jgi:hypothetical protein
MIRPWRVEEEDRWGSQGRATTRWRKTMIGELNKMK